MIIGTGNVIIAQKNGEKRRFGGYGYYFDDTLCGYDLGRLAIAHTLRVCEGSEKTGKMSELIMNQCPANPLSCLQDFYAKGKSYIASFAPMVFDALPFRDPAAEEIVETQCQKLVGYVNRATACMGFDNRTRLVFIGGLCRHLTALNQCLGLKMHLQPEYTNAGQETGAVRLAMKL